MTEGELLARERQEEDSAEASLRPQRLREFIGQARARENLAIFVEAARSRGEALDHVLLYGPPGLGKTTLAHIVAQEMGVGFRPTSGPMLTKAGDLAAILTNLQPNDVLFIDEIHRLNSVVEEVLYPAIEDFKLDLIIGEGPAARTVRIDLPPFTLVGATTRLGLISNPLRDRFGIPVKLEFYETAELVQVVTRAAGVLATAIQPDGAREIAARARGTPRIAVRLMKRVRDYAQYTKAEAITREVADEALARLDVDEKGLDAADRRYMRMIAEHYAGGPVGVETLAAGLAEQKDTLEDTVEPYLLQLGLLQRTPRGRMLTAGAFRHLGLEPPAKPAQEAFLPLLQENE